MAIDTREKRFSMINLGMTDITMPEADGAIDADDRAHLITVYAGIPLGGLPEVPPIDELPMLGMSVGEGA